MTVKRLKTRCRVVRAASARVVGLKSMSSRVLVDKMSYSIFWMLTTGSSWIILWPDVICKSIDFIAVYIFFKQILRFLDHLFDVLYLPKLALYRKISNFRLYFNGHVLTTFSLKYAHNHLQTLHKILDASFTVHCLRRHLTN